MIYHVVTNQNLPLIPYQEVLVGPQLGHVLPCEFKYDQILLHFLQVGGDLGWDIDQSYEVFYFLKGILLEPNTNLPGVSPGGLFYVLLQGVKTGLI